MLVSRSSVHGGPAIGPLLSPANPSMTYGSVAHDGGSTLNVSDVLTAKGNS